MSTFDYLKNIVKDKNIASIAPTSAAGVRKVCSRIDFQKRNVIVEYGPATGVFSSYILERLSEDSKLLLIETNKNFTKILQRDFKDKRVFIYEDTAENVSDLLRDCGESQATYVISGIPFSFFSAELRDAIVRKTFEAVAPEGKFLLYQTFFQKDIHLLQPLKAHFPQVESSYFFRNLPPLRLYEASKK